MTEKRSHTSLHQIKVMAYSIPAASAIAYMLYTTLSASYGTTPKALWGSQIVLGVTVIVLIFLWIYATMYELDLIQDHIGYTPMVRGEAYIVALMLSLLLTALGIFFNKIYIFSLIFATLCFFNMWGQYLTNFHIKEKLESGTVEPTPASEALVRYYFERPQFPRFATMLTASLVAGQVAVVGEVTDSSAYRLSAYIVMIATIISAELWILFWRIPRDREIRKYRLDKDKTEKNKAIQPTSEDASG